MNKKALGQSMYNGTLADAMLNAARERERERTALAEQVLQLAAQPGSDDRNEQLERAAIELARRTLQSVQAAAAGRQGGRSTSAAKRAAVRRNGRKGGHPVSADTDAGITRRGSGWQAAVRVKGRLFSRQFALDTPRTIMRTWRDQIRAAALAAGDK